MLVFRGVNKNKHSLQLQNRNEKKHDLKIHDQPFFGGRGKIGPNNKLSSSTGVMRAGPTPLVYENYKAI